MTPRRELETLTMQTLRIFVLCAFGCLLASLVFRYTDTDDYQKLIQDQEFKQALSTGCELTIALGEVLKTHEVTLLTLKKLKNDLEETHNVIQKVKVGGTMITATGSVISLAGFGLSFFSFGASLTLTGVGTALYGVGGMTYVSADISNVILTQRDLNHAQRLLDTDREMMDNAMKLDDKLAKLISSLEHKYPTIPSSDIKKLIRQHALPLLNGIDGVLEIGKGVFPLMKSASKTGSGTVWSGLSVWGKGLSVVYAALDIVYLVKEVYDTISIVREIQEYERGGKSASETVHKLEKVIIELEQHRNDLSELMALGN